MKAMIFAAGLGTRLKPLTDNCPKALVEVNGTPLLEIVIRKLKHYGFNDIIVNVHHFADKIETFLEANHNFGINITISDERDELLDTGGGLKKTAPFFNDNQPFLVYNVDILSNINLKALYDYHTGTKALATLAVSNRNTSRYLLFDNDNTLSGWQNIKTNEAIIKRGQQKDLTPLAFSGIHIIDPKIFSLINQKGKFSITPLYLELAEKHAIKGYIHTNDFWLDAGKPESLERASAVGDLSKFI